MKVRAIHLLEVVFPPSNVDKKDAMYCLNHRRKCHTLEQCSAFRRIFHEKHKAKEILFQEEAVGIDDLQFPSTVTKVKTKG